MKSSSNAASTLPLSGFHLGTSVALAVIIPFLLGNLTSILLKVEHAQESRNAFGLMGNMASALVCILQSSVSSPSLFSEHTKATKSYVQPIKTKFLSRGFKDAADDGASTQLVSEKRPKLVKKEEGGRSEKRSMNDRMEKRPLGEPDYPLPTLLPGKTPPRARYTTRCFLEDHEDEIQQDDGVNDPKAKLNLNNLISNSSNNHNGKGQGNQEAPMALTAASLPAYSFSVAPTTSSFSQHRINVHLHSPPIVGRDETLSEVAQDSGENVTPIHRDEKESTGEHVNEVYQPAGQHLLLDISNVDPVFLQNMSALAHSLVSITTQSQLTLLSYHCHDLKPPMGVSCLGVLLESHISIHTWPSAGILSMDLFTCGSGSLLPLLPTIRELFAIPFPRAAADQEAGNLSETSNGGSIPPPEPILRWLHKKRGFRYYESDDSQNSPVSKPIESTEMIPAELSQHSARMESFLLGWMGYSEKNLLVNVQTNFHHVQIYEASQTVSVEVPESSIFFEDGRVSKTIRRHDPMARHVHHIRSENSPDHLTNSNKLLFLDGVISSSLQNLEAYHETLVHMALLAHTSPKRVAIIGGGEGSTLREVLKFKSVEECTMVEIDTELMDLAEESIPEWNDCSDFHLGRFRREYESCFGNPRTKLVFADAVSWFIDHFGPTSKTNNVYEKYDVIIMDALGPSSKSLSQVLYGNDDFMKSIINALNDDGVFLSQIGIAGAGNQKAQVAFKTLLELLQNAGAHAAKLYAESHNENEAPWQFLLVFKDDLDAMPNFYAEPAVFDLKLAKQALPLHSGKFPFSFMDGATAATKQFPSRFDEHAYCQQTPKPSECSAPRGFDATASKIPASSLVLKDSNIPHAGRGVFYTKDYPKGTYFLPEDGIHAMMCMPGAADIIEDMLDVLPETWGKLMNYFDGYGWPNEYLGWPAHFVDAGIATFANHGCNGTNTIGILIEETESTVDENKLPESMMHDPLDGTFFSPYADRNFHVYATNIGKIHRDVKAGEEVLDNYLAHTTEEEWSDHVRDLRSLCLKQSEGLVSEYEKTKGHDNH